MTHTPIKAALCGTAFTLLLTLAASATAQTTGGHDHAHAAPAQSATAAVELPWSDAEVRRIDTAAGKVSLRHGEIKNLEMPPMTMVFQVPDPALLDKVKPGDKVKFRAEKAASGYVVTAIEVAR